MLVRTAEKTGHQGGDVRHTVDSVGRILGQLGVFRSHSHGAERVSAQGRDPFGELIHELGKLSGDLVEEQMKLVKRRSGNLPVMLLVHVAQRHGVSQDLVQVGDARFTSGFIEGDR